MRSRTRAICAWSILGLLTLALAAYWLPWIDHQSAALKLSGQDLGEFVKFLPQIRRGQVRFPRQVFYLPPFVAALSFVLLSTNRQLGYPRWVRILILVLAILALPGLLPPVWGHPRDLFNAEFRLQGIALVLGSLFGTGHLLLGRLSLSAIAFAAAAASVAGIAWSLSKLRRA